MYLTIDQLRSRTPNARTFTREHDSHRVFYTGKKCTVFLSHKHDDLAQLKQVANLLEQIDNIVYVDWLDPSMPTYTCGKTADNIKMKIKQCDKFILIATDGAIASKWCNWEVGYGDAQKYDSEKIALFPLKQDEKTNWKGNEYLELYPVIEYFNEDCTLEGFSTPFYEGYYVVYNYGEKKAIKLKEWLNR
ncbi:toll/interleukin-1 receptor domain-containing protein [Bacteroides gallinaceum]|jgi:hypothetical protein|uniref:Toll/interleukin-1 receptor domain-containing protein n=1 Tax=Bacteroides gallinaceum TaxID=1462571 RepID=A0ABT7X5S1_9BACE|nr:MULTISPECIES: toll/interleukin-1 receptor domain-containing protein [Bacteroides]MBV4091682.1 toll/interleukin-1 receptor domain-containing protein [Bacteroides thetaiotaomicron]MBV4103308.1 toll/interleukin-1 receptor domain-containing protein [Bacteroides thetaiotaomicron]MBV4139150.1 toll/interleukin-1 receptor domain-containing protein [Bacteroides thetaiotaomicron]MDN0049436.1 toll/interleukin-1 receptor domain-containing protein [Bacteroides gallinaceum]